jgi:hypothetical protein
MCSGREIGVGVAVDRASRGLNRDAECDRILQGFGTAAFDRISVALDRQFQTIHNRAQVILGICGVLISASVLVMAGRLIGRTGLRHHYFPGIMLVVAGVMDISAAATVVAGVLNIRWMTQQPGGDLRAWVLSNLAYRDKKTRAYRFALVLVLLSMMAYQTAIAVTVLSL